MPYLQPETNNQFGLQPAEGPQGRTNLYAVSSSEATAILAGDALVWSSAAAVKAAVSASAARWAGVAVHGLSTGSFAQATFNLLVYDDPDQQFAVAVTTSAGMGVNMTGQSFLIITTATGTGIPSTSLATGRSKHALGVAGSSAGLVRMVKLHPIEALGASGYVITTSAGKPQKYIVRPDIDAITAGPLTT